jgi:hypothetical protein
MAAFVPTQLGAAAAGTLAPDLLLAGTALGLDAKT